MIFSIGSVVKKNLIYLWKTLKWNNVFDSLQKTLMQEHRLTRNSARRWSNMIWVETITIRKNCYNTLKNPTGAPCLLSWLIGCAALPIILSARVRILAHGTDNISKSIYFTMDYNSDASSILIHGRFFKPSQHIKSFGWFRYDVILNMNRIQLRATSNGD